MSASKTPRLRVVVDGSNFATEGRVVPSLVQLDEAVRAFLEEHPLAEMIVVADASFAHRVAPGERARFLEAELAGEIVTPPAGAVGRGDAFILKIADRIGGVVLSNDSFQEFHEEYPWLFDDGRLIGGKPVQGVGWVFTPRLPVRGAKSSRSSRKLSVTLPDGAKPSIGTTLTPVRAARRTVKKAPAKVEETPAKKVARAVKRAVKKAPAKVEETPSKKITAKVDESPAKRVPVTVEEVHTKRAAKTVAPAKKARPRSDREDPAQVVALRRDRQPVNPEADFLQFSSHHRIGSRLEGEVTAFTSHGAVIRVELKGAKPIECYAPTMLLGDPAPARARDVLKRGDRRQFRLVTLDTERRIAELALL